MMSIAMEKSAPSKRSRIVVTLDEQQKGAGGGPRAMRRNKGSGGGGGGGGRRRGGRGRRILLIFLVLFVVVFLASAVSGYFWWQNFKTHPNYSLALVVDAAQRNDMAEFDGLVDMDQIVDNFMPQVLEKAGAQVPTGLGMPVRKQMQSLVLRLAPQIKQRVRDEVAVQVREISARAERKPFLLVALAMPFAVDTRREGDTARVNAALKERPIELTMQRNGERWKIVGVKDDVLVTRILETVARDLPASAAGPQIPDELRKQLEKKLPGKLPDIPILTK
jgi:uncharacterized membrane protein